MDHPPFFLPFSSFYHCHQYHSHDFTAPIRISLLALRLEDGLIIGANRKNILRAFFISSLSLYHYSQLSLIYDTFTIFLFSGLGHLLFYFHRLFWYCNSSALSRSAPGVLPLFFVSSIGCFLFHFFLSFPLFLPFLIPYRSLSIFHPFFLLPESTSEIPSDWSWCKYLCPELTVHLALLVCDYTTSPFLLFPCFLL